MIITLMTSDSISTLSLPKKVSGRYGISYKDRHGNLHNIAYVEGLDNAWLLNGSSVLQLLDSDSRQVSTIALGTDSQIINAHLAIGDQKVQFFVESASLDRRTYNKFSVRGECRIDIGRFADNQIIFDNKYVSSHHACLIWQNNSWSITDTQSTNGTFVNERRIATRQLSVGDIVYIMGLKIIVGNGFFALNNPDGMVMVNAAEVAKLSPQPRVDLNSGATAEITAERFFQQPRIYRSIKKAEIRIDAPPAPQNIEDISLALLLGPAITMGLTAVVMAAVAVINLVSGNSTLLNSLPTIVMAFAMLCGTLLWPLLTKHSDKKKRLHAENVRQHAYREYLDTVRNEIYALGEEQKAILLENSPAVNECKNRILQKATNLWERTAAHEDFLRLRLGLGDIPIYADIKFPEARFSVEADPLKDEVNRLAAAPKTIADAPICCSLLKNPVIGIVGDEETVTAFLQGMIMQLVSLHSYDDLKIAFMVGGKEESLWHDCRLLPHLWDSTHTMRYYAVDVDEAKVLSQKLEKILSERLDGANNNKADILPHYVIIATDPMLAIKTGLFSKILTDADKTGFSAITTAENLADLPKECSMIIDLSGTQDKLYDRNNFVEQTVVFTPESITQGDISAAAEVLANLMLDSPAESIRLPASLSFLEMYGVGKTEHLNALSRWKENNPVTSLQAPIGVNQYGMTFYLDLHEKAHGPHGLVAGMTGSGKSEFIITYILSLAVNYHPDEVAFILIDYKGGGLSGAFENPTLGIKLPHLAGTITNLDGASVTRALISIQSELRRRQAIFNKTAQQTGEGSIDIYKYQNLYRNGIVKEAVPHLFIISDEFAELKAQQPEFMAQLISAARIGRSLGVHLILATQKPTGVVDDQIWSNSRFRVCLKVQERADSVEMLKRPDAAELKDTGRFYLQVGFNELFELGQSAWCGAPYIPVDRVEKKRYNSVGVIDNLGQVLLDVKPQNNNKGTVANQVTSIVRYLSDLALEENICGSRLWLPEIPEFIYLEDLCNKYCQEANPYLLNPIIGEYDDPANQQQGLLTIPFTKEGNALIYGITGSGKTTLLNTLLVGLLNEHNAEQLNVYIVDMGGETLRAFADAPQVGDVLVAEDVEKIYNLFKLLRAEIVKRKKLFADVDGDYVGYAAKTADPLPQVLVIINNYSAFIEQFEALDESLAQLSRECSKYGIYLMMTVNAANAVRYRVLQNFSNVYALRLNDNSDYIGLFGGTGGIYPSKIKGRGIFKTTQTYEFQTAHFAPDYSREALADFITGLNEKADMRAPSVPAMPERLTPEFFQNEFTLEAIPIGLEKQSLNISTWNLSQTVITRVLTDDLGELRAAIGGIAEQLGKLDGTLKIFDALDLLNGQFDNNDNYVSLNFSDGVDKLFAEMVRRNNTYKTALANGQQPEDYLSECYMFIGLRQIMEGLADDDRDKLNTLLEKAELAYNIRFIICDTAKSVSALANSEWYKKQVLSDEGIWVGDGIAEQYTLNVKKPANSLYAELPAHFGYLVKHGKPILIKLVVGTSYEEEID